MQEDDARMKPHSVAKLWLVELPQFDRQTQHSHKEGRRTLKLIMRQLENVIVPVPVELLSF